MLQIALLGPLEVARDGQRVQVPGGLTSQLLVRLALEAGALVSSDRLVDDLWAAGAASTRRNTLQSKFAMLRRALGDPPVITSNRGGYALDVDPSQVDGLVALDNAVSAARLLDGGDDRGAADLCTSTLRLYGGEVLPGAGDGSWAEVYRGRLTQARMSLVEIELSARLRLGDVAEVIGELEAAVTAYPFQEGLWELLITALYRAGRQAEALETYQRVKARLADELGLDPLPVLQELERRVLTQDVSLGPAIGSAAQVAGHSPSGNLPSMATELIGRESDIAALTTLLGGERLVELVGPGGIGKTAVAIALGRSVAGAEGQWPGGVWLARLENAVSEADVVDRLVAALNGPGSEAALYERLRGATALVILDNCEHVVDASSALALRLLDAAPGVTVLCTSQVALGIDGEAVVELAPLELGDAVQLFSRRADAQRASHPQSNGDELLELCRSLDGLPLAIELAAARTKTLSVGEITRRLDDRFSLLADPTSRKPERRRSLRSTIGWSYDLLFPDDQRGLWAMATFTGGAPLAGVEFVLGALGVPAGAAIDVVSRLASRSLVIVDEEDGSLRYRLLDSIRAFALEAIAEAGLYEQALAAHATWFAQAAASSTRGVRSLHQAEYLAFARAERANIDAVLAWSADRDPLLGVDIVNGFGWAWVVLGDSRGAQRIVSALAAAGDASDARDRASALLLAAWIEASTGRLEPARDHIAVATDIAEETGDVDLQARSYYYLAYVVSHHGEFARAMELTDRSRAIYDGLDRSWDHAASELFAARAAISAGDLAASAQAAERVEHWLRAVEDPWLHVRGDAMLGELARVQHRFQEAVVHIGRAADTSRRLGFLQTEAYQVMSLGRAQCQAGDYGTGAATLQVAVDKARATGDVRLAALARVHLGRVLRAIGENDRARAALEEACAWHRGAGGGEQAALGECLLAAMDAANGAPDARERLAAILDVAKLADDAPVEIFALDALARVAATAGDGATAHNLCETADRRMEVASHFITELDRTDALWVRRDVPVIPEDRAAARPVRRLRSSR